VVAAVALVVASVVLSVLRSLVTYGNLELRKDADVLHSSTACCGCANTPSNMRRLRGGTLRQPLLVRLFGGARLDAGDDGRRRGAGGVAVLPPCPLATAEAVLSEFDRQGRRGDRPLRGHGPWRPQRWTRALALPAVLLIAMVALYPWTRCALACAGRAHGVLRVLAFEPVAGPWVIGWMRSGWWRGRAAWSRRRRLPSPRRNHRVDGAPDLLQRGAAGVATFDRCHAGRGASGYRVIDVPADLAWSIRRYASPWSPTMTGQDT